MKTRRIVATAFVAATAVAAVACGSRQASADPADGIVACPVGTRAEQPVVLVHGWQPLSAFGVEGANRSMGELESALRADGRCVYTPDYDSNAGPEKITQQFTDAVHKILQVNRANSVDLVGHSYGALIMRAVSIRFPDGANPVDNVVAVSGPQTAPGRLSGLDPAAKSFIESLNSGPSPVAASVRYTMIATHDDQISVPPDIAFLDAPNVHNVWLQDGCSRDHSGHITELKDPRLIGLVTNVLDPESHATIPCET
ncbi:lipase family alpha/beta hydrolase [Nocardia pseudovaccinii]|uniref:lipase family alpha/beta hydrolase n=1 Tax=Nocardia pseudovaccinii TaxID=189540 RepID=UPI003D89EA96